MKLSRSMLVAGLAFTLFATTTNAQTSARRSNQSTDIKPFATISAAPNFGNTLARSRGNHDGATNPVLELDLGARKRLSNTFGLAIKGNAGKMFDEELIGGDLSCRVNIVEGKAHPGCLPKVPVLNWVGASVGAEAYLGRTILGLHGGPASFGAKSYEIDPNTNRSSSRKLGFEGQFDATLPVYRSFAITLSAGYRNVAIVGQRIIMRSAGVGFTFR